MAHDWNIELKRKASNADQLTIKGTKNIADSLIKVSAALLIIAFISVTFYQCAGSPKF